MNVCRPGSGEGIASASCTGAVPRTHSGKKLEVPVKRILQGADPERVASPGSLADPSALDAFVRLSGGDR